VLTTSIDDEQVLALVRHAVTLVLEVDGGTLTRETRLVEDLRADSLALIEMVELVEAGLRDAGRSIHLEDDEIGRLTTVGDAVDLALSRL